MMKNKSPGLDGLPVEFYQCFWDEIGDYLVKVFNQSYNEGELTSSQRKSVMTLIHKSGAKSNLENYRPISLSNTDYKILAFTLAERLHKIISKIISTDQNGYIRNRYIGYNIRLVEDIIWYAQKNHINGAAIFLDFRKAFDTLDWNFLHETLTKFGFKESFKQWVKVIYNKPEALIKNNGWVSEAFRLERGIRQGCPLSALLFIICLEIMSIHLRSSEQVKGITINTNNNKKEIKLSQYADDSAIFLGNVDQINLCSTNQRFIWVLFWIKIKPYKDNLSSTW
jgi:hypothetical protein